MTSFNDLPKEITDYVNLVESDKPRTCRDQKALARHIRKCFETEDISVNIDLLNKYMGLARYYPWHELMPWEKFETALFLCTFTRDGFPRWSTMFDLLSRGAGKDGFISFLSMCLLSPYNPIKEYNIDIVANNKDQAIQPVTDLVNVLESAKWMNKLGRYYYHTVEKVQGRANRGIMMGRTNNAKGKDGLRSSLVVFNEVHQYENYDNIKVFTTGQGKRPHPRRAIITSEGEINDGPLDDYKATAEQILYNDAPDNGFLPFLCRLDSADEVNDPENWYKANPSLAYFPHLLKETEEEYKDWIEHPERNGDFMPKRMGVRKGFKDISVTDREKVVATKKPMPDLTGWDCTVGVDYAEINDFASVNLHFRRGHRRYDINHSWLCAQSKDLHRIKAPWRDWADAGKITVVDDVSISPELLAEYVRSAGERYHVRKLAMDHFRWTLVSEAFRRIGFDAADKNRVKLIRPSDIMIVEPVIAECFDRERFYWGDCPPLRWGVSNTKRVRASKSIGVDTGNFIYAKIEQKSRKTDPFMALVASMVIESELAGGEPPALPKIGSVSV